MSVSLKTELPNKEGALKSLIGKDKKIKLKSGKEKFFYISDVKDTKWRPSPFDLLKIIKILMAVKEGGSWICPDAGSIWTVYKKKRLIRVEGPDNMTNRKIRKILLMIGFSVLQVRLNITKEEKQK